MPKDPVWTASSVRSVLGGEVDVVRDEVEHVVHDVLLGDLDDLAVLLAVDGDLLVFLARRGVRRRRFDGRRLGHDVVRVRDLDRVRVDVRGVEVSEGLAKHEHLLESFLDLCANRLLGDDLRHYSMM